MLVVTFWAIHSRTSGSAISKPSHLTCLRRMAMRVSRSGRLMSTTTPWPKRERRRSSSSSSSRGGRSLVITICLPAS